MLAREKAIEEAKAAGQPIPTFPSILSPNQTPIATTPTESTDTSSPPVADNLPILSPETIRAMKPEAALGLRKKLMDMDPFAREAEEKAVMAELRSAEEAAEKLAMINTKMSEERQKRRDEGRATVGDTINGWFGW